MPTGIIMQGLKDRSEVVYVAGSDRQIDYWGSSQVDGAGCSRPPRRRLLAGWYQ